MVSLAYLVAQERGREPGPSAARALVRKHPKEPAWYSPAQTRRVTRRTRWAQRGPHPRPVEPVPRCPSLRGRVEQQQHWRPEPKRRAIVHSSRRRSSMAHLVGTVGRTPGSRTRQVRRGSRGTVPHLREQRYRTSDIRAGVVPQSRLLDLLTFLLPVAPLGQAKS